MVYTHSVKDLKASIREIHVGYIQANVIYRSNSIPHNVVLSFSEG